MEFTVARDKIVEIDCLLDPERLARLDLALRDDAPSSAQSKRGRHRIGVGTGGMTS